MQRLSHAMLGRPMCSLYTWKMSAEEMRALKPPIHRHDLDRTSANRLSSPSMTTEPNGIVAPRPPTSDACHADDGRRSGMRESDPTVRRAPPASPARRREQPSAQAHARYSPGTACIVALSALRAFQSRSASAMRFGSPFGSAPFPLESAAT